MGLSQRSNGFIVRTIISITLLLAAFNYSLSQQITDSFHEGEYLGSLWQIRAYLSGTEAFPLLVHGPMDFLPALLAGLSSDDRSIIFLTRAINTSIAGVTWIIFFDLLLTALKKNTHQLSSGIVSILMFAGMIAIIPAEPVERQQAFLAVRDIFLVLTLWFTLRGLLAASVFRCYVLMAAGGITAGASLYWAYDRFLASFGFSGALVLALLFQRRWRPAAALILGITAGLLIIPHLVPTGGLVENAKNLFYWLRFSSEVWHLSYLSRAPAIPTAVAMIALLLIFVKAWRVSQRDRRPDPAHAFFVSIIALQAFFLLKYLNLPRQPNNYYFVWPFILLTAGITVNWPASQRIEDALKGLWAAIAAAGSPRQVGLTAALLSLLAILTNNMVFASLMNARALGWPPVDAELLPRAIRAATGNLSVPKEGCVLLWSNEGVFATALRRPFCTRYMYSVYASASHEAALLQQIKSNPPAIVIFDSPNWSMDIYGRSMRQRLPVVEGYLSSHYRFLDREGYLIGLPKER